MFCGQLSDKLSRLHRIYSSFPISQDLTECQRWIDNLENANIRSPDDVTTNMVVCEKHWLPGYETVVVYGKKKGHEIHQMRIRILFLRK